MSTLVSNSTHPGILDLGRPQRIVIGIVVAGAVVIAAIGFAGSYTAVRDLAVHKGFGWFANVFPIGVDAGIVVLLALDLLLTWFRIPFPLLRQTAWLLTVATVAFNAAAAWPDPLGVGMHAVIPVLFVVSVEAARHAIGRIADITADRHMESVRIARWLLAFPSTFRLWRRMKLWELRSYDEVIRLEQDRLVYRARLRAKYGRTWRRKAPVESLMPLRLARHGVPLAETGPAGLAAAGITVPDYRPADIDGVSAKAVRTTLARDNSLFADPDKEPELPASCPGLAHITAGSLSGCPALEADNSVRNPKLSALSGRMSASKDQSVAVVRADNGGHPAVVENLLVGGSGADEVVRTGESPCPAAASVLPAMSGADMCAERVPAADEDTVDADDADSVPDKDADAAADCADNGDADRAEGDDAPDKDAGADNNEDKAGAGDKLPRGAIVNGVRAQLAIGITNPKTITTALSGALGQDVDEETVGRTVRRLSAPEPKPQPQPHMTGGYA